MEPPSGVPVRRRWLLVVVAWVALVALVVVAYQVVVGGKGGVPHVQAAVAKAGVIDATPGGLGRVNAGIQYAVTVDFPGVTSGVQIQQVDVVEGTNVQTGQPLLELDPTPLEAASTQIKLQLSNAQSSLQQVQASLAQLPALAGDAAAANLKQQVSLAQQNLAVAQAGGDPATIQSATITLNNVEAALAKDQDTAAAHSADLAAKRFSLEDQIQRLQGQIVIDQQLAQTASGNSATLVAPFAGVIAKVRVTPGQIATPGQILMQLVNPTRIRVGASVPINDRYRIAVGQPADITFDAVPGLDLSGTVIAVSPRASADGLESSILVEAANTPDNRALIGSNAYVRVHTNQAAAVTVPKIAVQNMDVDPTVFVVINGRAVRQHVTVGSIGSQTVEILSGVKVGNQVVVAGNQGLGDGERVVARLD